MYTADTRDDHEPPPPAERGPWHRHPLVPGLAAAALSLPLLGYHLAYDHGIYAMLGDLLHRGGVAYRDAWEFRPPGIFWTSYLGFSLFGRSESSFRLMDLLGIAASASALFLILRDRLGSPRAGWAAALAYPLVYVPCGHWIATQCESFQAPLMLWAVALWPRPGREDPRGRRCFAAGALAGLSVLFKTPGIFFPILLLMDRLFQARAAGPGASLRPLAATAAGIASAPSLMFLYYGLRGALPDLVFALFVYAPNYAQAGPPQTWDLHVQGWMQPGRLFGIPACLLALLGLVRLFRSNPAEGLRAGGLFATAALGIGIQGRYYDQHLTAWCPWIALGAGLAMLPQPGPQGGPALRWIAMALALALAGTRGAALGGRWTAWLRGTDSGDLPHAECDRNYFTYRESAALASAIRAESAPGERLFPWLHDPLAVFLADRPLSGPYSHVGMMVPYWEGTGRLEALLIRLRREPPDLILIGSKPPIFQPQTPRAILERFEPMHDFVRAGYRHSKTIEGVEFWKRRAEAGR